MLWHSYQPFNSKQIAGGITLVLLEDLRDNNFTFSGFPAVVVSDEGNEWTVKLSFAGESSEQIKLSTDEADKLVKIFTKKTTADISVIKRFQPLIRTLERKLKNYGHQE